MKIKWQLLAYFGIITNHKGDIMTYEEQKEILELQIEVCKLYLKCLDKEQNAPKPSWYYTQFPPKVPPVSPLGPITY